MVPPSSLKTDICSTAATTNTIMAEIHSESKHYYTCGDKYNANTQTATCQLLVWSINLFLVFKKFLIVKWLHSRCRCITTNQRPREYT